METNHGSDRVTPVVAIRPFTSADASRVERFYEKLSAESSYTRFFCARRDAYRNVPASEGDHVVLLAEQDGELVGIGEYYASSDPKRAEVAFAVLDRMQRHGLGTQLLHRLGAIAHERGVRELSAQVLVGNVIMMAVFRHSGFRVHERLREGVYDVVLALD